jgi:hypothetical protein
MHPNVIIAPAAPPAPDALRPSVAQDSHSTTSTDNSLAVIKCGKACGAHLMYDDSDGRWRGSDCQTTINRINGLAAIRVQPLVQPAWVV